MTDYDQIAGQYRASKLQPWREFVEKYTLLRLAGEVRGLDVIDLACGDGHYARELAAAGARVTGVDASAGMIELARASESNSPAGIEYRIGDVRDVRDEDRYDLAIASWLFNYARTAGELSAMCKAVARALKPGGRLVALNTDPNDPPSNFDNGKRYGFVKRAPRESKDGESKHGESKQGDLKDGELKEGARIVWTLTLPDGEVIDIVNYHLERATVERCLRKAGMADIRWRAPLLHQDALLEENGGGEHWRPLMQRPPFVFIEARKA